MFQLRFISQLLIVFALLFAQQGATLHALHHSFSEHAQQKNKQSPHSSACEQCTSYAQLGGALNSRYFSFELHASQENTRTQHHYVFHTHHTLNATARGPPVFQRSA